MNTLFTEEADIHVRFKKSKTSELEKLTSHK